MDYDIITSHGLDYLKIASNFKDNELRPLTTTSIVISAAITAYARIHISKLKLDILKLGGEIYYSDTDSIVTNIQLPNSLVSHSEIGKLKLEHVLQEAVFISNKIYWMCDISGKTHVRSKGIKSSSLTYSNFLELLNNNNVKSAIKRVTKTHWNLGYVLIKDDEVTINSNSYTKRDKIYNNNKLIDTKPICINKIDKDLVLYKNKSLDLIIYKNVFVWGGINKGFIVVNKSNIDIKTVLAWISLFFIIPISSIAYIISLEEGEFNLDPFTSDYIYHDKENKVCHSDDSPLGKDKEI